MAKQKSATSRRKPKKSVAQPEVTQAMNAVGFILQADDPFALGTVRHYLRAAEMEGTEFALPYVLPNGDPASKEALKMYIVRAEGGGDPDRAAAAKKHLETLS